MCYVSVMRRYVHNRPISTICHWDCTYLNYGQLIITHEQYVYQLLNIYTWYCNKVNSAIQCVCLLYFAVVFTVYNCHSGAISVVKYLYFHQGNQSFSLFITFCLVLPLSYCIALCFHIDCLFCFVQFTYYTNLSVSFYWYIGLPFLYIACCFFLLMLPVGYSSAAILLQISQLWN